MRRISEVGKHQPETSISVPIGDGGNPSPSGEAKVLEVPKGGTIGEVPSEGRCSTFSL